MRLLAVALKWDYVKVEIFAKTLALIQLRDKYLVNINSCPQTTGALPQ